MWLSDFAIDISVKHSRKGDWLPCCSANKDIKPPWQLTDLLTYTDSNKNFLEIILRHGNFGSIDRLGGKSKKYKVSSFYYIIGNVPNVNDNYSSSFVQNYLLGNTGTMLGWLN